MGLKEPGLRGSLRNTGSVLPAFFDVTITNTNSPVQEGDILTVDYSADNTGDAQDMQDIRLEIDSVQEDVDPDVMLAGGASTTGTLEWDTTGEPEAEYTATVLSDDDSDSVIVEIGSAIPDTSVSRDADDDDTGVNAGDLRGIQIETNLEWPAIDGEISSNTSDATLAEIYRVSDGQLMGSTDISDKTAGETFRLDLDNNLVSDETYNFVLTNEFSSWTAGRNNNISYPVTSEDEDLSIVAGAVGETGDASSALSIVSLGNLQ